MFIVVILLQLSAFVGALRCGKGVRNRQLFQLQQHSLQQQSESPILLRALQAKTVDRTPVWLMRQVGY
jgi:hypothetical protein